MRFFARINRSSRLLLNVGEGAGVNGARADMIDRFLARLCSSRPQHEGAYSCRESQGISNGQMQSAPAVRAQNSEAPDSKCTVTESWPITRQYSRFAGEFVVSLAFARFGRFSTSR